MGKSNLPNGVFLFGTDEPAKDVKMTPPPRAETSAAPPAPAPEVKVKPMDTSSPGAPASSVGSSVCTQQPPAQAPEESEFMKKLRLQQQEFARQQEDNDKQAKVFQSEMDTRTQTLFGSINGLDAAQKSMHQQLTALQGSLTTLQNGMAQQQTQMETMHNALQQILQRLPAHAPPAAAQSPPPQPPHQHPPAAAPATETVCYASVSDASYVREKRAAAAAAKDARY